MVSPHRAGRRAGRGADAARRDGEPLLLLDRVGKGRDALLLSDQIWLWSRGHEGGGPQAELLRRVAHWLMQEPELEENALTARVADGRLTIERRSTDPAPPGAGHGDRPGRQDADLGLAADQRRARPPPMLAAPTPGVWQVSDGAAHRLCRRRCRQSARIRRSARHGDAARKLARASGGGVHCLGTGLPARRPIVPELRRTEPDRSAAGSSWVGLERRHDHVVTGIASLALLPSWIALPLMLGLMVLAWRREGQ